MQTQCNALGFMKNKYIDLVEQTFDFPQEEFSLDENDHLEFHEIPLMDLVKQYGTPLKFTYLPKISQNIKRAKNGLMWQWLKWIIKVLTTIAIVLKALTFDL